jgi:hypothetical protein
MEVHHEELVNGIAEQMKPILDGSKQAVYIYLDDEHKVCNQKMADLVGMKSAREWAEAEAPLADVVEEDQPAVIKAYENASVKMKAGHLAIGIHNSQTGKIVKTDMVVVPVAYMGHVFTMHFLSLS